VLTLSGLCVNSCLGCPVLQGYGLSETCAVATVATPEHTGYGHVGVPSQCCGTTPFCSSHNTRVGSLILSLTITPTHPPLLLLLLLEIKLFSVPEMEYNVTDVDEEGRPTPRGEVCIRGPNVFVGYYKMDEATCVCPRNYSLLHAFHRSSYHHHHLAAHVCSKATFTEDGYLQTGDIGRWNPDGTLSIIDRKKNIFKLSQGEYIAYVPARARKGDRF